MDRVVEGNLPASWISASPATTFLSYWGLTESTILTIRVPEETLPGVYSGSLRSKGMAAHGYADAGDGIQITVTVPSGCDQLPSFVITSFGPEILWPPNHSMVEVEVEGQVLLPQGCTLFDVGYSIDDEYGIYTGVGTILVDADGYFSVAIPLETSRMGRDKDGRHYTITLFAQDEAGVGVSETLDVLVPHDMRNKNTVPEEDEKEADRDFRTHGPNATDSRSAP